MKEHKKLYKSGKNWVTATILTAAITATGLYANSPVHAATDEQNTNSTVAQIQNDQTLTVSDAQTNNQSIDNASKQAELEQQIKQAQTEVQQKQNDYNNAKTAQEEASKELMKIGGDWARNQRYVRQYKNYAPTTIDLYNKTDTQLFADYDRLKSEANDLLTSEPEKLQEQYYNKWLDAYNKIQQIYDNRRGHFSDQDQATIEELTKEREKYNAKYQEMIPLVKQGNKAYEKASADSQAALTKWRKFRDSPLHTENWANLGGWYTFDPSYLSPEDQNKYNKAVAFLNQYSAKLNKINDDYTQAARNNDNATQAVNQVSNALAQANFKLTALKAELAKLQSSDSSAGSSTAKPSDSSASSSAAKPSDSSASSSAAKPSDSSASSSAAKPSDSSASSSAAKPSDSSASSSAVKPSDSSASSSAAKPSDSSASSSAAKPSDSSSSSSAAKPSDSSASSSAAKSSDNSASLSAAKQSDSSATQLNTSSGVAQSINDDKVSFGAADIKSGLGDKPAQVAFVAPNSSQASNPSSNQSQKKNSLPQTGNDNSISLIALGALTAIFGLGVVKKKQF